MLGTLVRKARVTLWFAAAALILLETSAGAQSVSSAGGFSAVPQLPPSDFSHKKSSKKAEGSPAAPLVTSADQCQTYISKLSGERLADINALNALAKANKGKLDPIAACPRFRALVSVESRFKAFLTANKDWCGVPDNIVDTVSASAAKDASISVRACALAAQFRKQQQEAAAGLAAQAPKLPSGPL